MKTCACGCGEQFEPSRAWQRYLGNDHRLRAKRERSSTVVMRISLEEKRLLERLRKRSQMPCTPTFLPSAGGDQG